MVLNTNNLLRAALAGLALAFAGSASSQNSPDQAGKNFDIPRAAQPPQIDGDLSDPMWANAARIDDFLQATPIEYRASSEQTEAYIAYDDDAIYVGFVSYDSRPEEMTANVLQQEGSLENDDKVIVILDPFDNQRSGYLFQINPNGVRKQAIFVSGTQPSYSWAGIWNGTSKIIEGGWTAELAIPFKSLSFDPTEDTWGVNFARELQRTQEEMAWYSLNGSYYPASSGKMNGISGVSQGIGLDVVPAISGNSFENKVIGNEVSEVEPSVDIFYKITPQINLAVTLNTDFSATEADDNTLNNTRFRQFFDEKRAFFLNDFDAFKFGLAELDLNGSDSGNNALAFYSRRIGLSENGTPVDIVGGAKISGRAGNTEFGALVMRQDEFVTTDNTGTVTGVIDPTNAIVARVSQTIFEESKIGFIYTDGNPAENEDNSLYGLDFHYRNTNLSSGKSLDAVFMYQQTEDPDFTDNQSAYSAAFSIDDDQGWTGGVQYFAVEENYHAGLGFTQRTNAELLSSRLMHKWIFEDFGFIQQAGTVFEAQRWQYLDSGDLDSEMFSTIPLFVRTVRGDLIRLLITHENEEVLPGSNPSGQLGFDIPADSYTNQTYDLRYQTPTYFDLKGTVNLLKGDYYTGEYTGFTSTLDWQANRHILLSLGYDLTKYEFETGSVFTREAELSLNVAFNSAWSLASKVEYDNVRRQAAFTNRLRWNMQPGQDLWIVFNQGMVDEDDDYKFAVQNTQASFKFRYTFRY
jgi:hypothetical protein